MNFLVDSSAWIEYLEGSREGEKVHKLLNENKAYHLNYIIGEVVSKIKRKEMDSNLAYKVIISNSKLFPTSQEIAKEAGLLHAKIKKKSKRFGLVDAFIIISARKLNAKILTGDKHFKNFKEAIML